MSDYYLAYGSNLNKEQMKLRCPKSILVGTWILRNYQLVYKGYCNKLAYLTIEPNQGCFVPLGVYKVSFLDKISLDKYEGYPEFYEKKNFPILVGKSVKNAYIYVMKSSFDYYLPNKKYISICKQGYEDFGFPQEILDKALEITKDNISKKYIKKYHNE